MWSSTLEPNALFCSRTQKRWSESGDEVFLGNDIAWGACRHVHVTCMCIESSQELDRGMDMLAEYSVS